MLALDFDGVICDSIEECLVLSFECFQSVTKPGAGLRSPSEPIPLPLQSIFRVRRHFVRPARHYYLLWKWITDMPDLVLSQTQFDDLERQWPEETARFERLFFERRHQLMQERSTEWLALNPLFPGVQATWSSLLRHPLYIVTTKDRQATTCILDHHALAVSGVYANGSFAAKADAILAIAEREHIDPSRVAFVDDHPDHLRSVAGTGAWPLFAQWGYSPQTTTGEFALVERFSDLPAVLGGER